MMLSDTATITLQARLKELFGISEQHVQPVAAGATVQLQPLALTAFSAMQKAAAAAGHDLQIASGFRSFSRQTAIWQRKYAASSQDHSALANILHWSALPGTSRHHWGSDIDIYAGVAMAGASLQLVPEEYSKGGPCWPLYQWLQEHALSYGFYWPYQGRGDGVAAEPWHLSYAPLACHYQPLWEQPSTLHALADYLQQEQLPGIDIILPQLKALIQRYVLQVEPIPTEGDSR